MFVIVNLEENLGMTSIENSSLEIGSFVSIKGEPKIHIVDNIYTDTIKVIGLTLSEAGDICMAVSSTISKDDVEIRDPSHVSTNSPLWDIFNSIKKGEDIFTINNT